jgi:photosystem II stability/assembly factor-like uncharacterized protein
MKAESKMREALAAALIAALLYSACSRAKVPGRWSLVEVGVGDAFYSANFVSDKIGWLNGQSDRSYRSPEQEEGKNPKKKKEDPLKANQGFQVLQTTDGGATWHLIPGIFENKIRSVWFVDPAKGWALTIDRNILHTTDGGLSWSLQRKAEKVKVKLFGNLRQPEMELPEQIDHIYFVNEMRGWAWGGGRRDDYAEQPGILLTTVDGGRNWNRIPYPFENSISAIFFLDSERAWVSITEGKFYRTTDGGLNWSPIEAKLPESTFRSIFFLDENDGWVVGRSGRLAHTTDGGRTWRKMVEIKDQFRMRDIFFVDGDHGWAVGAAGAILYTPDGGTTWLSVASPIGDELLDITFANGIGWAVGLGGAVIKFTPSN